MRNMISLVNNPYIIACQDDIKKIDNILVHHWLNSLVIERLQDKIRGNPENIFRNRK